MIRVTSLEEIEPGDVLWAYAGGVWRHVTVVGKRLRRATVVYTTRAGTPSSAVKWQALGLERFRRDRPPASQRVVDTPAPVMDFGCLHPDRSEEE